MNDAFLSLITTEFLDRDTHKHRKMNEILSVRFSLRLALFPCVVVHFLRIKLELQRGKGVREGRFFFLPQITFPP